MCIYLTLVHSSLQQMPVSSFKITSIRTNLSLYTFDAPFIALPSTTWWRFLFSCYFSPCGVQMRLKGLFSSCVQPAALQILGFQALKNTAGDASGSVITNMANPALP